MIFFFDAILVLLAVGSVISLLFTAVYWIRLLLKLIKDSNLTKHKARLGGESEKEA